MIPQAREWTLSLGETQWGNFHAEDDFPTVQDVWAFFEVGTIEVVHLHKALGGVFFLVSPDNPLELWPYFGAQSPKSDDMAILEEFLEYVPPSSLVPITKALQAMARIMIGKA